MRVRERPQKAEQSFKSRRLHSDSRSRSFAEIFGEPVKKLPAKIVGFEGGKGGGQGEGGDGGDGGRPVVEPAADNTDATGHTKPSSSKRRKNAGGFDVKFEHMGEEENRAKYDRESRTIYINLDHPQLVAARGGGEVDDPNFRRLSNEVAFTEYAIGLETENVAENWYLDFGEPLTAMRSTIDRVSRSAAALFAPNVPLPDGQP